ncbi:MAG: hypothetical protein WCR33_06020 [Bacilli bacterium]
MKVRVELNSEEALLLEHLLNGVGLETYERIISIISDNNTSDYYDDIFVLEHDINPLFTIDLFESIRTNFKSIKSITKNLNVPLKSLTSKWFETKDLSEYGELIKENNYHYIIEFGNDTVDFTHDIYYVFHILKNTPNVKSNVSCIYDIKAGRNITKEVLRLL